MNLIKNKYRISAIVIVLAIFLIITSFYSFSFFKVKTIYNKQTEDTILDLKKSFISDTINNLIYEINSEKSTYINYYSKIVEKQYEKITSIDNLSNTEFIDFFKSFFEGNSNNDCWTSILFDTNTNELLYSKSDLNLNSFDDTNDILNNSSDSLYIYKSLKYGDIEGLLGVSKDFIDNLIKNNVEEKVSNLKFESNSYISIIEVQNFDGGDNYARVLVNNKFPDFEGRTLSTNILDINGDLPYLTELEGIKKSGELFYTSSFNNINSDIAERLSYSKLYSDFNWIISMHIYLDDIDSYIININEASSYIAFKTALIVLLLVIIFIVFCFLSLYFIEKRYLNHSKNLLENEINTDTLTNAISRRGGVLELTKAFNYYNSSKTDIGIMMFDIDKFKTINDTFGHNVGDIVLKEVTTAVSSAIRDSDILIRWGGDEFIIIFYGLKKENALFIGEKISSTVYNLNIPALKDQVNPSISIGFSYFKDEDTNYEDVLSRADSALYRSKTNGRNQSNITF